MDRSNVLTNFPLQITFRRLKAPPDATQWIRQEAAKLDVFHKRIMSCRVAVERPLRRRESSPYHVRIDLTVPSGELVVGREPTLKTQALRLGEAGIEKRMETRNPHKNLRQAINDAFRTAGRRLQDYARRQRGDVKHRERHPEAKVSQLFKDQNCGFLTTPDGRHLYFHRDSVLSGAFGRLKIGTKVKFSEEPGDRGSQADSVRIAVRRAAA